MQLNTRLVSLPVAVGRFSEQTILADGVFAAMEMDERLLFRRHRRRRRHMLIVLSSEREIERRGRVRFSPKRN